MKALRRRASVHTNIKLILAGLGGQGVVFTTRFLAQTATALGLDVMTSEVHGMSQRGGSVISHLTVGATNASLIARGTADLLLALDPDEAVRNLVFLSRGGVAFVNGENGFSSDVMEHLDRLEIEVLSVSASRVAEKIGSARVANVVLVGFACAHPSMPLGKVALSDTLTTLAPVRQDLNLRALEAGYCAGLKSLWS